MTKKMMKTKVVITIYYGRMVVVRQRCRYDASVTDRDESVASTSDAGTCNGDTSDSCVSDVEDANRLEDYSIEYSLRFLA